METKDDLTWLNCYDEDLWIFDKLILSKRLGYICGPKGVDVPKPGNYIVRPCVNLMGMSRGAKIVWIEEDTDNNVDIPDGYFWCELFTGRHLSVDYIDKKQVLCVEGFTTHEELYKFNMWKRVNDNIPYPDILKTLKGNYKNINIEMIGGNIIEIHLRLNPDFQNNENIIIPVWEGESIIPPNGFSFKEDKEYKRLGFFIKQKETI